jgi:ribose transport system ATP-binding protein
MTFAVEDLRKSFSGVPVLKNVNLAVTDGEIHALLGANGAGKSTLIKCISGAITPDSGTIFVGEQSFSSLTPKSAKTAGVAVIYQDLSLAISLNVADNIFLGQELRVGPFIRRTAQVREARDWLRQLGVDVDPQDDLASLGNAELQIIEIIKSLRANPRVLILDEPTASLTEREAEELAKHLLSLKKRNLPVMYVTHRLAEIFGLADRVTVLRGGEVVLSAPVKDVDRRGLVSAIVGRELAITPASTPGDVDRDCLLELRGMVSPGIGPIHFDVRSNEILGVFGLIGSGRTELVETLFGARKVYSGSIRVAGKNVRLRTPADALAEGIALVPSDRLRKSVLGDLTAAENTLLPRLGWLARFGIRRKAAERRSFAGVASRLNLQPRRGDMLARRFSGGNQQKLVLGRWLQENDHCRLMLLDEPTQGVDVGARHDLYSTLRRFAASGERAVVVTSSEPEELMQLAHRVVVLSRGRVVGEVRGREISEQRLITLAHLREQEKDVA